MEINELKDLLKEDGVEEKASFVLPCQLTQMMAVMIQHYMMKESGRMPSLFQLRK